MESEVALINKKAAASDLRRTIQSNLEEVNKLDALVNNLLRLAQLEVSEVRQNFTDLSGKQVVEAALKQAHPQIEERKVKLSAQLKDLPLYGDEGSLVQLLTILLDNAVKYSPTGSPVDISMAKDGEHTIITVQDYGPGIEPEALEHVFDRFYRADKSRTKQSATETEGYGLGLSIAKMIADVHGGSINLSSRVDHGTTATVSMPTGPAPTAT